MFSYCKIVCLLLSTHHEMLESKHVLFVIVYFFDSKLLKKLNLSLLFLFVGNLSLLYYF